MTRALLLIGHGSRDAAGNRQFLEFVQMVRAAAPDRRIEACFIELAEPDIPAGLAACVAGGATEITVLPVTLFNANHARFEIPEYIHQAQHRYPGVTFRYGRPFMIHPLVHGILKQRYAETGAHDPQETGVLLVGRGSSDAEANSDLWKAARLFWEENRPAFIELAYAGVTQPDVPTGLRRCARLGARRVVVLPYLLFTGVLVQRIQRWTEAAQAEFPEVQFHLAGHLGAHENLVRLVLEREAEALAAEPFDAHRYFERAGGHHHHHHHHHHGEAGHHHD